MKLKNLILGVALTLISAASMQAGAPPTVMFLPDKTWCNANNYVNRTERNGKTRITENYDEAFLNSDLKNVITQLNNLLTENGLRPKTYGESAENDDDEEAEEEMFEGAQSGAGLESNSYDDVLNKLKPDIIIKLGWDQNKIGFSYTCSYRLEAVDTYSGKSIAAVTAETPTVKTTIPLAAALKNAATEHMSNFASKLQEHFDDIQANGREITLTTRIIGNGDATNFNTEFGGKELSTIIDDWIRDNTQNHVYSQRNATRNRMQFEQMRIPLSMNARQFVTKLQNYLKSTYGIIAENTTKGLGSGRLYIGEK